MDLDNTGNEWKEDAPLLSAMSIQHPFTVPENYFTDLQGHLQARCVVEDARFNKSEGFAVPANYFESLIEETESRVIEQEIRELAPSAGFTVPEEYFERLKSNIFERATEVERPEAVIKTIRSNWLRYAAAACVTIALGSMLIFNQESTVHAGLSGIPDEDLINYLQIHSDIGDTPVILESLSQNVNLTDVSSDISDAELEEYISTTL